MGTAVSIVKCEDYEPAKVFRAVREAVDLLGGVETFLPPGGRALLKPNLLSAKPPESAVCTHPAVVEAVASLINAAGGTCFIGDSPSIGSETPEGYRRLLEVAGMREVAERTGSTIVRFDDSATERESPEGKVFRRFLIADALSNADTLISISKFKTHGLTMITGAVKNLFGCVTARRKLDYHLQAGDNPALFAQMLVDLLRVVSPALSIMDAIVGMDGQGPAAGRRRNFGLILASADPVALDAAVCMAAGLDPMSVPTLRLATEQGIGTANPSEIEILGVRIEDARIPDFIVPERGNIGGRIPKPVFRMMRNQLVMRPTFLAERCSGCGLCVETCPTHAISGEGKRLKINYSECIRCYCCQEVCPEEAILLKMPRLRRFFDAVLRARS